MLILPADKKIQSSSKRLSIRSGSRVKKLNSKLIIISIIFVISVYSCRVSAYDFTDVPQVGLAFLTNLALHETGHYVVADHAGAEGNSLNFFKKDHNSFFFGLSTVTNIDDKAKPAYHLGGELASGYTFEYALRRYRGNDSTTYNNALMFFSMTDFLWYTTYAFYISPVQNNKFDPEGIVETTGINKEAIFLVSLTQASLNAIRVYTNEDRVIPSFIIDKYFIGFNVKIPF